MQKIRLDDFTVPETCGKCRFIRHYESGPYARNPHCCCELMWYLKEEDYKVDQKSLDKNCPLKILNTQVSTEMYVIHKHTFDISENLHPWNSCIIGYIDNEEDADKWISIQEQEIERFEGWDGHMYPYFTKEKIEKISISDLMQICTIKNKG